MYNSLVISNFFIEKSKDTGIELTPMKILKMVYISHGWFLAYNNKPLIKETVLAWRYGPVIIEVYDKFKKYRSQQITSLVDIINDGIISDREMGTGNEGIDNFLNAMWNHYSKYDGLSLSSLTHQDGSPWAITINKSGVNSVIPEDLIKQHYKQKAGL